MRAQGFDADRPVSPLDREAIAHIEVGRTAVTPRVARASVAWFLLVLVILPLTELVTPDTARPADAVATAPPWQHLGRLPHAIAERLAQSRAEDAWTRLIAANRAVLEGFSAFESALEDGSRVGRTLRPPTQRVLSGWLGAGNERVYIGRDGWLFYRPDVESLTGRGFLDETEIARRIAAAREYDAPPSPDPRPAILQFNRDLESRGITLILVPTPVKASIHPEKLASVFAGGTVGLGADEAPAGALQNASYHVLVRELRRDGVLVFDPSAELTRVRVAGQPAYLATDTHWRPEAMQQVAEALAKFIQQHVTLPPVTLPGYRAERREAQNLGDTAAMLDLPPGQTLYSRERVPLRFIVDAAGDPWRPSREADILFLGDSFTNIFSLPTMGWGESAGLAEQVSYALQRPVDRIVQNDDGAYATRVLLAREIGGSTDRLGGKRVVIWQFAARELAFGDWRVIELR
jgi:alginate O-acetyltransferase complex protein AlgJ